MAQFHAWQQLTMLFFILLRKGGNDKTAVVFNNATQQLIATLKGHTKKVTQAVYHPEEVRQNLLLFFAFIRFLNSENYLNL
jgi:hypothetical protein